ncbi:MAG: phosphate ABC transporter, permease protein PstA [Rhodobacterales bacterium]|nr:MAG: phosphate ABC transporter, permease protein PstA [Rhodobacterales bacterium]
MTAVNEHGDMLTESGHISIMSGAKSVAQRNSAEKRFQFYGIGAIAVGLFFLCWLLWSILSNGLSAFTQTTITLPIELKAEVIDPRGTGDPSKFAPTFAFDPLIIDGFNTAIAESGATVAVPAKELKDMLSKSGKGQIRSMVQGDPSLLGTTQEVEVFASANVDGYLKGRIDREAAGRLKGSSVEQLDAVDALRDAGVIHRSFNWNFLFGADASENRPEQAGMGVAMVGSLFMMLTVLLLTLPIGVAASIYLEEFAPKNRLTDIIEVNISNLAAVPSIVFGILGLAVFIQFVGLPQSAPLVGGLVLTLMTLPTIIISTRAALKAVPPSIRDAALGVGASKMQSVFHHVLPLAMPGILTGTIIGLAQALGETAPLLLIGMVGYVATNYPDGVASGFLDPNSAMPAQIYQWISRADGAFYERAWGGIIILLLFLMTMNIIAIILRRRFERRW